MSNKSIDKLAEQSIETSLLHDYRNEVERLKAVNAELLEACKTVFPFLKDCVERPRNSAQMQRIASDAEDSLSVITAAIARAEGRDST